MSLAKEVYIPSVKFTFLRLCSSLKPVPFRRTHKVQLSLLSKIFPCSLNFMLFPELFIPMQIRELSAISQNPKVRHLYRVMSIFRHYVGQQESISRYIPHSSTICFNNPPQTLSYPATCQYYFPKLEKTCRNTFPYRL